MSAQMKVCLIKYQTNIKQISNICQTNMKHKNSLGYECTDESVPNEI